MLHAAVAPTAPVRKRASDVRATPPPPVQSAYSRCAPRPARALPTLQRSAKHRWFQPARRRSRPDSACSRLCRRPLALREPAWRPLHGRKRTMSCWCARALVCGSGSFGPSPCMGPVLGFLPPTLTLRAFAAAQGVSRNFTPEELNQARLGGSLCSAASKPHHCTLTHAECVHAGAPPARRRRNGRRVKSTTRCGRATPLVSLFAAHQTGGCAGQGARSGEEG